MSKTDRTCVDKTRSDGPKPSEGATSLGSTPDIQAALASLIPGARSGETNSTSATAAAIPNLADTSRLLASLARAAPATTPVPASVAIPSTESQLTSMLSAVAAAAVPSQQSQMMQPTAPVSANYSYSHPEPAATHAPAVPADSSISSQHLEVFSELWQLLNGTGLSSEKIIEIFTFFHKAMTIASQSAASQSHSAPESVGHGYGDHPRRGRGRSRSPSYFDRQPVRYAPPRELGGSHNPIGWDHSLLDYRPGSSRKGFIKVMSRTLFVGGVNGTKEQLHDAFAKCGPVQSVIVNAEKRHAFVKMYTRADAEVARLRMNPSNRPGMDDPHGDGDSVSPFFRSTGWGVGFAPSTCMDRNTGISIINIDILTPADGKWLTTAAYGGTGGRKVEAGMVLEEPDIEVGSGVSSKGMSIDFALFAYTFTLILTFVFFLWNSDFKAGAVARFTTLSTPVAV